MADDNAGNLKSLRKNNSILVENIESLDFNLISADAQNKEITVRLKGDADFVWAVDTVKLLEEMMNYKGKDYTPVFQNYPAIKGWLSSKAPNGGQNFPETKTR